MQERDRSKRFTATSTTCCLATSAAQRFAASPNRAIEWQGSKCHYWISYGLCCIESLRSARTTIADVLALWLAIVDLWPRLSKIISCVSHAFVHSSHLKSQQITDEAGHMRTLKSPSTYIYICVLPRIQWPASQSHGECRKKTSVELKRSKPSDVLRLRRCHWDVFFLEIGGIMRHPIGQMIYKGGALVCALVFQRSAGVSLLWSTGNFELPAESDSYNSCVLVFEIPKQTIVYLPLSLAWWALSINAQELLIVVSILP